MGVQERGSTCCHGTWVDVHDKPGVCRREEALVVMEHGSMSMINQGCVGETKHFFVCLTSQVTV